MNAKFDETSYEILRALRWPKGVVCPYCEQMHVTMHTKSALTPRRRYLCLECRRTFSDLTGTPFARINLPLSIWLVSVRLIGEGLATSELAKALEVKWDTAVHMQRRLALLLTRPGLICRLREALK